MPITITEKQFKEYLSVQEDGLYNMFDPKAMEMTSLNKKQWLNIITNYSIYYEKWGSK